MALFWFSKKTRGGLPLFPLVVHLWVWLNMCQNPWIFLNTFENAWINCFDFPVALSCLIILHAPQTFEDVLGSKCARVLNMTRLHMQGLNRVLNLSEYGSICLNNAWICMNMAEYCWMSLIMPANAWINCFDYDRVLNIPHYLRYLIIFWICLRH